MINVNYQTNVLLNQILWKTIRMNGNRRHFIGFDTTIPYYVKKNRLPLRGTCFRVIEGVRTPDPQNHNLML